MTQNQWTYIHKMIVEIVKKAPDMQTVLDELDKLREAGPPKE